MNDKRAQELFRASGEFNAWVNNQLSTDNNEIYKHAGYVSDENVQDLLSFLAMHYEPTNPDMPTEFSKTDIGKMVRKREGTRLATKAVNEGNISQLKYFTGKEDYSSKANSLHTLINLREKIGNDAYVAYLFGHMGNGKTDFANLLGEIAKREMDHRVISNQKSLFENEHTDAYIRTFGDLIHELTKHIDSDIDITSMDDLAKIDSEIPQADVLVIFDEASQKATGYANDAYDASEKLGKLVKLIRKVGGKLIVIGHTGKDVHPDLRRLSNDCIHKVSKKTAEFYESVSEAEGVDLKDTISGIPETNWTFKTTEVCIFEWTLQRSKDIDKTNEEVEKSQKEDRNVKMLRAYMTNEHPEIEPNENDNITQGMIAEHYGIDQSRVSQIIAKFKETAAKMEGT